MQFYDRRLKYLPISNYQAFSSGINLDNLSRIVWSNLYQYSASDIVRKRLHHMLSCRFQQDTLLDNPSKQVEIKCNKINIGKQQRGE